MKKFTTMASYGALLAASGFAGAAGTPTVGPNNPNFRGSDTMFNLVNDLLDACEADGVAECANNSLNYIGGGSGNGQSDLITTFNTANETQIAPMSRPLLGTAVCNNPAWANTAKGWAVSADALVLLAEYNGFGQTSFVPSQATGEICDTVAKAGGVADLLSDNERDQSDGVLDGVCNTFNTNGACVFGVGQLPNVGASVAVNGGMIKVTKDPDTFFSATCSNTPYIFGDQTAYAGCPTVFLTPTVLAGVPSTLDIGTADLLRLLFTGRDHWTNNTITTGTVAQFEASRETLCNSSLRRALIAKWESLFKGCGDNGKCPSGLRHLIRRGDDSGTTDVFLALIGAPSIVRNTAGNRFDRVPFCNGLDWEDRDPVRVACNATDMTCGNGLAFTNGKTGPFATPTSATGQALSRGHTKGVVQAINVPEGLPTVVAYNRGTLTGAAGTGGLNCSPGRFRLGPNPQSPRTGFVFSICGDQTLADANGRCLLPTSSTATGGRFDCVNAANNKSVDFDALKGSANADGRVYNQTVRNADGTPTVTTAGFPPVSIAQVGAFYRGLSNQTLPPCATTPGPQPGKNCDPDRTAAGADGQWYLCEEPDSTEQIACLTGAIQCSVGFAGRTAAVYGDPRGGGVEWPKAWVDTLEINNVVPTDENVLGLTYQLSRKLFFNTFENTLGFADPAGGLEGEFQNPIGTSGDKSDEWRAFMTWLDDPINRPQVDQIVADNGFIPFGVLGRSTYPGETLQCADACGGVDACVP